MTLRRMRKLGTGPVWLRISAGRIGYPESEVDAYLAAQSAKTKAPREKRLAITSENQIAA